MSKFGRHPKVYAAEGYDALMFLVRAIAGGIDLKVAPFEMAGVTGRLQSAPGETEIVSLEAIPVVMSVSGKLKPFTGRITIESNGIAGASY
jgi:hypothetical protein